MTPTTALTTMRMMRTTTPMTMERSLQAAKFAGLLVMKLALMTTNLAIAATLALTAGCGGSNSANQGKPDMTMGGTGGNGPQTILNVYVTWYGFNDNSCQVETDHNCNTIAYGK